MAGDNPLGRRDYDNGALQRLGEDVALLLGLVNQHRAESQEHWDRTSEGLAGVNRRLDTVNGRLGRGEDQQMAADQRINSIGERVGVLAGQVAVIHGAVRVGVWLGRSTAAKVAAVLGAGILTGANIGALVAWLAGLVGGG